MAAWTPGDSVPGTLDMPHSGEASPPDMVTFGGFQKPEEMMPHESNAQEPPTPNTPLSPFPSALPPPPISESNCLPG